MKNFKLFEKCNRMIARRVTLIAVLLAMCMPQLWAGNNCGFWTSGSGEITFTANGVSKTMAFDNSTSDYTSIGTVTTLEISSFWIKTWKKHIKDGDFTGNVCQVEMYYAIHTSKNVWGDDSEKHKLIALHDGSYTDNYTDNYTTYNQQWKHISSTDVLDGLTPGTTYWIDFYFEIQGNNGSKDGCYGQQATLNNNTGNYHASFTYASEKTTFEPGQYVYLDARNQSNWKLADFSAHFWFKRYDTSADVDDESCVKNNLLGEEWVYYAVVPEGDYTGKLQVNRDNPSTNTAWCNGGVMTASDRSSKYPNCLGGSGSDCGWTPSWTTYCPPKATSSISDNGTVTYGGDGGSSTPYLVEKGGTIKVQASSTNILEDGNMTTKYHFYDNTTSKSGEQSGSTYQFTASSSENVTYQMRVNSYNQYNSTNSSDKYSDKKYYKTVTCYTVTYHANGGSGSVPAVSGSKYKSGASVTLATNTGGLAKSGYKLVGWNTATDGSGTHYELGATLGSISANQLLYAEWLQVHAPSQFSYTSDYGKTPTKVSCDLYEWYSISKNGSGYFILAGEQTSSASGTAANVAMTLPATSTYKHQDWFTIKYYGTDGNGTPARDDEFANLLASSAPTIKFTNTSFALKMAVSGYTQFSIVAKDNDNDKSKNKYIKVVVDGDEVTGSTTSKSATVRRFNISSGEHLIELQGTSGNAANVLYAFSLRRTDDYPVPTSLAASDITSSGVTLTVTDSWNTGDYDFYVSKNSTKPAVDATPTESTDDETSVDITGLDAATNYYAWVRSKCSNTRKSDWVALTGSYFTTEAAASTYSITYECYSATSGCPSNATEQTALPDPLPTGITKNGYTFGGWYTDDTFETSAVAGATLSDDVTLYAKWTCTTPTFTAQPSDETVCKGASPELSVSASANGGSLSYQWYSNTTQATAGATTLTNCTTYNYSPSTSTVGTMYYYCVVTNTTGSCSATSDIATVTVTAPTAISSHPTNVTNGVVGSASSLSVTATGTGTLTYQWYTCNSDGSSPSAISSATNASAITATLSITPASAGTTYYKCVVHSDCGSDQTSSVASILAKNNISPSLTYDSYSVLVGSTLSATLTGNSGDGTVTWTSSDDDIATVASDGTVTGVSAGTVTITASIAATSSYWGKSVTSSTITVSNPTYSVTYKANGGTGDDVTNDSETTISSNTFTAPATKAFVGWNTKSDGTGTPYAVGDAVDDNLTLYAQWRYKVMYIVGSASESSDIRTVLDTYYAVTERVATTDTYDASIYSSYALIVISESVAGDKAQDSGKEITEIKKLNKPILNLKAFIYGSDGDSSKRWKWGAPNAGKKPKCIYVKNDTYANLTSHPIFADLTPDGSDSIQILKTPLTTKPIQPIGSFVSGKEGYTLALVPNKSSGSGTAIHEMTAAQRSSATGETITSKYLLISIQEGELSNLSDNGKTLIKNAADYLITGSQWVPQYKITHSAASDGSYTIQVGAGSATDDDTMSAAGTTITLAATPEDGYKLDSWTVTGDVSSDAITVTSNQFAMPAEAVTVAATFVEDSYTISFDGNGADGGTEVDDVTGIDSGNDANLPENTWTKTEHTFAGWKTNVALTYVEKGGEDEINVAADGIVPNEATIKNITGNITLTAQWQVNEYDVHFWVGIDVSVEGRFSTYEYGEEKVLPTTVLRSGYLFDGWYTNSSLTGDPVTQMPADATGEQDYYPKWKALSAKCLYITGDVIDAYNEVASDPGYYMHNGVKYVFGDGYEDEEDALVLPAAAERSYVYLDLNFGEVKEVQLHISDIADKNTAEKGISWGFVDDDDDIASVVLTNLDNISDHEFSFRPTGSNMQYFVFKSHGTTLTIDNICVYYEAKTYSVTYDRGTGASGTAPSDLTTYYYNDVVTVQDTTGTSLKKTGYTFRGWFDGTTFYVVGDKFKITGNTTLTAVWQSDSEGSTVILSWFETTAHSPSSGKPDSDARYCYGYTNSAKTNSYAYTLTTDWANSGACGIVTATEDYLNLGAGKHWNIYADNVTTGGKPAVFSNITAISVNVKLRNAKKKGTMTIKVGSTTVADAVSLSEADDSSFKTYSYTSLANLSGIITITENVSGDSGYDIYLDNITIVYGSGSSNFTVSFASKTGFETLDSELPGDRVGVPNGATIGAPEDPIAIGYAFLGWYKDAACSAVQEVMIDTLAITKDTIIYAKWVENVKTFTGGASTTAWETEGNWDAAGMPISAYPYCYSQIYIKAPAEMAKNTKEHVGRVDIVNDGSSNTGKLTINSGAMLIVYDKVNRVENWGTKTRMATIADDIYIGSERDDSALSWRENGALNGALIMGDYDREEQADSATVQFASLAYTKRTWTTSETSWGERDVNQYIGIPFAHTQVSDYKPYDIYTYTNVYLYSHDRWNNSWAPMSKNQDMYEFTGYDLICFSIAPDEYTNPKPIFDLKGELASTEDQRIHLRGYEGLYGAEENESMLANSWTAPIHISSFEVSDFENAEATIYMFNAGTAAEYDGNMEWASSYSTYPGQYTAIPINDLKLHPYYYEGYKTIPSMQSFSIITLDNDGNSLTKHDLSYLTMDYKRLVYDPAVEAVGVPTETMHAPRRVPTMEESPLAIMLHVHGVESGLGDRIRLLEREDFSFGRDNGWETSKLLGIIEAPSLYAVTEVGDQATVAVPDVEGLGLTFQAGEYDNVYTFNFEYEESEEPLYLLDRKTGIYTRVLTGNTYSFVTTDKNFNERFMLTRNYQMPEVATGLENTNADSSLNERVQKVLINDMIYILRDGHIYDATGKMLK